MLKTKYNFLKKIYKDYAIVFLKNKRYFLLYKDLYLMELFNGKNILSKIEEYHINYLIIEALVIIKNKDFDDNRYRELLYKGILIKIIKKSLVYE